jgi:hypothetical protein
VEERRDLASTVTVRNEFSAVELTLRPHGRGQRLEIRSTLFNTVSLVDATVLEALSRMDQATLAGLVSMAMTQWDERHEGGSQVGQTSGEV